MNPTNDKTDNNSGNRNNTAGKVDPETQRKADRALIILYVMMFVFILAPFAVWFLLK